ncbi:MAG: YbaB/EbfC family nucleoid-associated protein [bacterium]
MIFGNLGNMGEMLKMAKEMKGKLSEMKKELQAARYEETVNGIKVVISGEMQIMELKIPGNLTNLDKQVQEAINKVMKIAKDDAAQKMKGLAGGLGLPPGMM